MKREEWKRVDGYPHYWVSRDGRVISTRYRKLKTLTQTQIQNGYLQVGLVRDGKQRMHYVHALVAAAFIGPRPAGMDVDHVDGSKTNNAIANLRYLTHAENVRSYRARLAG